MTPVSPAADGDRLTLSIVADGRSLEGDLPVISVDVWSAVNAVSKARIVLTGPAQSDEPFSHPSVEALQPGKAVEIRAGFDAIPSAIFCGIVVGCGIELTGRTSAVVVDAAGHAVAMTASRKTAVFNAVTDAALIERLIAASGLTPHVSNTPQAHELVTQDDVTDWELIVLRAGLNGMLVTTDAGTVTVAAHDASQPPVLVVTYGESMYSFDGMVEPGRSPVGAIRGRVSFQGCALARPGSTIELKGVGGPFNNDVLMWAVHQEIAEAHWTTRVEFRDRRELSKPRVPVPSAAAGPASAGRGLPDGLVKQLAALDVRADDTDRVITIRAPGHLSISLNHVAGEITVADAHQNSVALGGGGVRIVSASNLAISAAGHIEINAGGGLALHAAGDLSCRGLRVDLDADTACRAHGRTTADLASPGVVTVQGALVKIN